MNFLIKKVKFTNKFFSVYRLFQYRSFTWFYSRLLLRREVDDFKFSVVIQNSEENFQDIKVKLKIRAKKFGIPLYC